MAQIQSALLSFICSHLTFGFYSLFLFPIHQLWFFSKHFDYFRHISACGVLWSCRTDKKWHKSNQHYFYSSVAGFLRGFPSFSSSLSFNFVFFLSILTILGIFLLVESCGVVGSTRNGTNPISTTTIHL